jgi:hypothetical protein
MNTPAEIEVAVEATLERVSRELFEVRQLSRQRGDHELTEIAQALAKIAITLQLVTCAAANNV